MHIITLGLGIISIIGMLLGFIPCLGWINWINIPISVINFFICIIVLATTDSQKIGYPLIGLICSIAAIFLGAIRLVLGGGII